MIIGLAGHIDHGKTALVRALTGVQGDRLKEERARGITIDLGFAYLPTPDGRVIGFIDVPGHERFVHTMLAGAAGIDLALLVVAADDGVMPQTREHLAILDLLGIPHGVIAITKADLVTSERLEQLVADLRAVAVGTLFAEADIIPVSVVTDMGVDVLRRRLVADSSARRPVGRAFRLAVDRVFTLTGAGTVVTGTVLSGAVHVNDQVVISPSGLNARVRSLHAQNQPAESAGAGDRCALALAGDGISVDKIHRGDVVLAAHLHAPTDRIDAVLDVLDTEPKAIGQWFPVRFHHAAMEMGAHIVPLDRSSIAPGQSGVVQIVLEKPLAAASGDRFVIRDVSAQRTIGGGALCDLRAPSRRRRTPERFAQIAALSVDDPTEQLAGLMATPPFAWDLSAFVRDHAFKTDDIAALCPPDAIRLAAGNAQVAIAQPQWYALTEALCVCLAQYHADNPDHQGIGRERLRLLLKPRLPAPTFLSALQHWAQENAVVLEGSFVRLPTHVVQLTPEDEALSQTILPLLGDAERFRPPRVRDIADNIGKPEVQIRRLLKLLSRLGHVDEIAHDHFFLRAATAEMVAIVSDLSANGASFIAAQFRDRVSNGRKVAIQILEFFDRHGVTLRRDDQRRVNAHRLDLFGPAALGSAQSNGRESSPVGRSDFKSEWGSETVSGGFDSHSLPPLSSPRA